ncbi:MAG: flagellar basal body-associated FliL family protein [Verrucomicrobia bacterium]|nr:flagellar basal body-associated FliL family protein [Verrucomicrobiota bacterium]
MAAKPTEPAKGADAAHPPAAGAAGADKEKNAAPETAAKPAGGGIAAFIPLIAAIVIAPVLSWAIGQFVLMPQLKKQIAAPIDPHAAPAEHGAAEPHAAEPEAKGGKEEKGGHGKKGEAAANGATYEFENVVVNLAGTMGTRYLKTAFLVTGTDKSLRAAFEANKPKMVDITINVLSSLSLADLEEAGAKNLIREKLIGTYNQAFGKKIVDQVYFSDFVVQ